MKYTREQAEAVLRNYNEFLEADYGLHPEDIKFLNAKFPTIEVGKWYKADNSALICATSKAFEDGCIFAGFGINVKGEWEHCERWVVYCFTPATEQEVLDRLTEEAKKRYKVGDRVKSVHDGETYKVGILSNRLSYTREYFAFSQIPVLNLSTGEWAEVIEANPIHDKIEALERELAELKELIKIK
jgi:hypothetical protein